MLVEAIGDRLLVWAPAKVNLYLEVLRKRADGYHDIETVMVAVQLYDTLAVTEDSSGKIILECDDATLPTGDENLIVRAARLLQEQAGGSRGARIRLRKRIPMAAGLAGGSSDAAATLVALDRLWQLNRTAAELAALAARLGSDVAFFLGTPAAWCTGRGERVEPLRLEAPLWFVLLCPPLGLSTAAVYRALAVPGQPQDGKAIRAALERGDVLETGRCLHNRLEEVAMGLCPALAPLLERLRRDGPAGRLMSGSGTSLFALCRDQREALRLAGRLRHDPGLVSGSRVFVVRSCS